MEGSGILESLDSLWFFSSVLWRKPKPMADPPTEPSKPIFQTQQNESGNPEIGSSGCTRCEFSAEIEPVTVQVQEAEMEAFKATKKEEARSGRRKRKSKRKRKVLGELELGIDERDIWDWEFDGYKEMSGIGSVKMPLLTDGMAMKEHLKSWAYAVACTVR
ncbi:hypothetical protein MANES_16G042200v8 [Manihot esculenta]|uniref:Uncharacterized protein n=1 Tax=Manihot esculenta TaxID=3983 RepID=A0A2C9U8P3_MANES|nr:hypothetical protein MANES_16G042200v8 [Manihot esculenta]